MNEDEQKKAWLDIIANATNAKQVKNLFKNEFKEILENEGILNIQDSEGNTPLHLAVKERNLHVIKFLVEMGADESLVNDKGYKYNKTEEYNILIASTPERAWNAFSSELNNIRPIGMGLVNPMILKNIVLPSSRNFFNTTKHSDEVIIPISLDISRHNLEDEIYPERITLSADLSERYYETLKLPKEEMLNTLRHLSNEIPDPIVSEILYESAKMIKLEKRRSYTKENKKRHIDTVYTPQEALNSSQDEVPPAVNPKINEPSISPNWKKRIIQQEEKRRRNPENLQK